MKTPLWFPQSFFSRTLWLVLIVVLFSKALTLVYLLMNEDMLVDRQYSHGVGLVLRAYWAADEENREKIADAATLTLGGVGGNLKLGNFGVLNSAVSQSQFEGAQRLWTVTVEQVVRRPAALALRWQFAQFSPFSLATGRW